MKINIMEEKETWLTMEGYVSPLMLKNRCDLV